MPHVDIQHKFELLPKYPHMRPADVGIWERFLRSNPGKFRSVTYDVRVGDAATVHEGCSECARGAWFDLTRWQIDVVAEDDEAIYIIEVKPLANARALGQVDGYRDLYVWEKIPTKPVKAVVLTDHEISTTRKLAAAWGIELWVV